MTIERVFVAGAGLMGHGIAQAHAAVGKQVILYEPDLSRAAAGRERISGQDAPLFRIARGQRHSLSLPSPPRSAITGRIRMSPIK